MLDIIYIHDLLIHVLYYTCVARAHLLVQRKRRIKFVSNFRENKKVPFRWINYH
jgi:hypothetical protein